MCNYEPAVAPRVPAGLATLLRALLAIDPAARPPAEAARTGLAALAAESVSWPVVLPRPSSRKTFSFAGSFAGY